MDISGGGVKESTEDIKMRSGAVLTGAVLLATLHVILANQDVKNNNLAQNTEKGERTNTILTDNEKIMVQEEIFLEKLFLKISPKNSIKTWDGEESPLQLKSFLRTFQETPALQKKGKNIHVCQFESILCTAI